MKQCKMIVFDIDGVLTDGTVWVTEQGMEVKRLNLKEVDAVFGLHDRGYRLAAVTGENTPIVSYFERRFPWDFFYRGIKQKAAVLEEISRTSGISLEEICYIGDGKYDAEALFCAGMGVCPHDASRYAKNAADIVLDSRAGHGCVEELAEILLNDNEPGRREADGTRPGTE